jgi:NAD(P)-dependent dehydrogenase (short-subunit alcohol dehydrogenase family)
MSSQQVLERTEMTQPSTLRLQGKIAVITGAGSGMGLAMATRFAAEGAAVVAGDWNVARLDQAVAHIRDSGGTILGAQGEASMLA